MSVHHRWTGHFRTSSCWRVVLLTWRCSWDTYSVNYWIQTRWSVPAFSYETCNVLVLDVNANDILLCFCCCCSCFICLWRRIWAPAPKTPVHSPLRSAHTSWTMMPWVSDLNPQTTGADFAAFLNELVSDSVQPLKIKVREEFLTDIGEIWCRFLKSLEQKPQLERMQTDGNVMEFS